MARWFFEPGHTAAEFRVRHMMVTWVRGHFKDIHGTLDFDLENPTAATVEATIDARGLWTGEAARDTHLKSADFLDVEKFPTIVFRSTRIEHAAHDQYKITGNLTIRDVTRPVTFDVVYSGQGKDPMGNVHAGFSAHTTINRKDWGLTWNVALETGGLLVGEEVKLALEIEAVKAAKVATVAEAQSR